MPFVAKPDRFSSCIIIPGRMADPDGFVTEHREIDGLMGPIKVYFSVAGLRQLAQRYPKVGLVPRNALDSALATIAAGQQQVAAMQERIDELEAFKASVAGVTREDYQIRRPIGRPKEKV